MKKTHLFVILLLLIFSSAFSQNNGSHLIDAATFKQLITKENGIVLDVRTPAEFARGHINGASILNIYDKIFPTEVLRLPKDKPIYIYCATGIRSRSAANFLVKNGYTKVYDLKRGMMSWNSMKYPVVKNSNTELKRQKDEVSVEAFNRLLKSNKLVLVDFYAPWCAPCKKMMPLIDKLKADYKGKVLVLKVNVDASKELVAIFKVPSVPYFVYYKNEKQVYKKSGIHTLKQFVDMMK